MGLRISPNTHSTEVIGLLRRICPDPTLTISPSGEVTYSPPAGASTTCVNVGKLANGPDTVTIEMLEGDRVVDSSQGPMNTCAGCTQQTMLHFRGGVTTGAIEIYLDASNADGGGYWCFGDRDTEQPTKIDLPMDCVLAHEIAHATGYQEIVVSEPDEERATEFENAYRAEAHLPKRDTTQHAAGGHARGGRKVPVTAPPAGRTGTYFGPFSCFIATAAYGSPSAPEVERLREIRDTVVRKVRSGEEFYQWVYERYCRFSPTVAAMMENDPEVRQLIRWLFVTPLVQHLDLFLSFPVDEIPAEGSAGLTEPWRSYLLKLRGGFEQLSSLVPLPQEFVNRPSAECAAELAIVLRYLLWTPEARSAYLRGLREAGGLPLAARDATEYAELKTLLESYGFDPDPERLVLGPEPRAVPAMAGGMAGAISNDGNDAYSGAAAFLYLGLANNSSDTLTNVSVTYTRSDVSDAFLLTGRDLRPGESQIFCAGDAMAVTSVGVNATGHDNYGNLVQVIWVNGPPSGYQSNTTNTNTIELIYNGYSLPIS